MTREARRAKHAALEAYIKHNPGACTRGFDGVCRCPRGRRFDVRPPRRTATVRWQQEV